MTPSVPTSVQLALGLQLLLQRRSMHGRGRALAAGRLWPRRVAASGRPGGVQGVVCARVTLGRPSGAPSARQELLP